MTCEQQESVNKLVKIDYEGRSFMASVRSLSHIGILLLANSSDILGSLRTGHKVALGCDLPGGKGQLSIESVVVWICELAQDDGERKRLLGLKYAVGSKNNGESLRDLFPQFRPQVLIVHSERRDLEIMRDSLREHFQVWAALTAKEALSIIGANEISVLIIDQTMPGVQGGHLLDDIDAYYPDSNAVRVVIARGENLSLFEDFIRAKRIFYMVKTPILLPQVLAVVQGAAEYYWSTVLPGSKHGLDQEAASTSAQRLSELSQRLMLQRDLPSAAKIAGEAVEEFIQVSRAYCIIYDPGRQMLLSEDFSTGVRRQSSAALGLLGFIIRTGLSLKSDCVSEDPRYFKEVDDPQGEGDESLLAEPIINSDSGVIAILVALRDATRPKFSQQDSDTLKMLADQFAPIFRQLELSKRDQGPNPSMKLAMQQPSNIFRLEALESYNRGYHSEGDILRISPTWIRWTYPLLILVALAGLLYSFFGRVSQYSVGPAVVRIEGRVDLTAVTPGIVTSIEALPGQPVVANQLLVRFYNAQEAAQLESINRQYDLQMIETLRNPSDTAAQQALALLRAQKQATEARLEERSVRAPQAGFISDIRIRPGQHVSSGDTLLSLGSEDNKLAIVAVLPGHFRPQLKSGMPLRLELSGYRNAYQELTIDSIGDEVVGPNEIRRYLGQEIADTITISGPLVLVHAQLSSKTFYAGGQVYTYHDGMPGTVEVRVRDERVLFELFPGLKGLFEKSNE